MNNKLTLKGDKNGILFSIGDIGNIVSETLNFMQENPSIAITGVVVFALIIACTIGCVSYLLRPTQVVRNNHFSSNSDSTLELGETGSQTFTNNKVKKNATLKVKMG